MASCVTTGGALTTGDARETMDMSNSSLLIGLEQLTIADIVSAVGPMGGRLERGCDAVKGYFSWITGTAPNNVNLDPVPCFISCMDLNHLSSTI